MFMNSENSKMSKRHVLMLKRTNKSDLRIGEMVFPLSNLNIYYTWKNIKSSYNNNKFKTSAPIWNVKFELIIRWIAFCIRYSRLFSVYFEKAWRRY